MPVFSVTAECAAHLTERSYGEGPCYTKGRIFKIAVTAITYHIINLINLLSVSQLSSSRLDWNSFTFRHLGGNA